MKLMRSWFFALLMGSTKLPFISVTVALTTRFEASTSATLAPGSTSRSSLTVPLMREICAIASEDTSIRQSVM